MAKPPAAPDYSALTNMAQNSATYSFNLSPEQFDYLKKFVDKSGKLSDIFVNKALGEMDKQIADSDRARERYQSIYEPAEEQYAAEAQSYSSPERQEYEAGKAEADVSREFEGARQAAQDRLESYGVDPSQTRSAALDLGSRLAEAGSQAAAGNVARQQTIDRGQQMMENVINVGRGYPGAITNSAQAGGQFGTSAVNSNLATTASAGQSLGTPMAWQQLGNQGLGTWGNLVNAQFGNAMDAYKAKESSSSGFGGVLGAIGGIASAFLEEGGVIPDGAHYAGGGPMVPQDPNAPPVSDPAAQGQAIPAAASPSAGAIPDDIPAQVGDSQTPIHVNAGEFVMPRDVTTWLGEKGMQAIVMKARKEMAGGDKTRPAQPTDGPGGPPINSAVSIPTPPPAMAGGGVIPDRPYPAPEYGDDVQRRRQREQFDKLKRETMPEGWQPPSGHPARRHQQPPSHYTPPRERHDVKRFGRQTEDA